MSSRGAFDLAFDNTITQLTAFATAEAAIDATYDFAVEQDLYRYTKLPKVANVILYQGQLDPEQRGSGRAVHLEYDIEYWLDLIIEHAGDADDRGDKLAGYRLRFLEQQCITALMEPDWYDMGLTPGTVTNKRMPRFEPLPPELQQQGERPIIGARGRWQVRLSFDPTRVTGTDLDQLHVDAGKWAALYDYGG
jgi:hypothetical protein